MSDTPVPTRIQAHQHPDWLYRRPRLLWWVFAWYRLLYQRVWLVERTLQRLGTRAARPDFTALDAGCGEGLFTYRFARRFSRATVWANDLRPANIRLVEAYVRSTGLSNVLTTRQDLTRFESPAPVDLCWCVGVLHLVPDDAEVLRRLAAAVRPGGILLLYTPVHRRRVLPWFETWYRRFGNYEATHAVHRYTYPVLVELLHRTGWEIEEHRFTNGTPGIIAYEWYTSCFLLFTAGSWWQRALGGLVGIISLPGVVLLSLIDYYRRPRTGNGLQIVARRKGEMSPTS